MTLEDRVAALETALGMNTTSRGTTGTRHDLDDIAELVRGQTRLCLSMSRSQDWRDDRMRKISETLDHIAATLQTPTATLTPAGEPKPTVEVDPDPDPQP